jgi:hypothetical protein
MAAESNARKRINRFVDEYGDELLSIPKAQQNELLDLVYTNQGALARTKLKRYLAVVNERRHQTSVRAAVTKRTRDEYARIITDSLNDSIRHNPNMKRARHEADFKTVRRNVVRNEDPQTLMLVDRYANDPSRLGDELRLRGSDVSGTGIISASFYQGTAS